MDSWRMTRIYHYRLIFLLMLNNFIFLGSIILMYYTSSTIYILWVINSWYLNRRFLGDQYCSAMQVIPSEIPNFYTTDIWISTINDHVVNGNCLYNSLEVRFLRQNRFNSWSQKGAATLSTSLCLEKQTKPFSF